MNRSCRAAITMFGCIIDIVEGTAHYGGLKGYAVVVANGHVGAVADYTDGRADECVFANIKIRSDKSNYSVYTKLSGAVESYLASIAYLKESATVEATETFGVHSDFNHSVI